jgi:hypothetical protein
MTEEGLSRERSIPVCSGVTGPRYIEKQKVKMEKSGAVEMFKICIPTSIDGVELEPRYAARGNLRPENVCDQRINGSGPGKILMRAYYILQPQKFSSRRSSLAARRAMFSGCNFPQ